MQGNRAGVVALLGLLVSAPCQCLAQRASAGIGGDAFPLTAGATTRGAWPLHVAMGARILPEVPSPAEAALLSAALPGVGQHLLGQSRKWIYGVVEVLGWVAYLERRAGARRLRDDYRDLAWEEARLASSPRVDGDFPYYETLTKWTRSGSYDADQAQTGLQPELDTATYNGSIWSLARRIFTTSGDPGDPGYPSALAYYAERAYGPELLWDWTGSEGARGEFADLITRSDDRFRQATTAVGVVIANHLVSAADAFLTARGRGAPVSLRFAPSREGGWLARVDVRTGR